MCGCENKVCHLFPQRIGVLPRILSRDETSFWLYYSPSASQITYVHTMKWILAADLWVQALQASSSNNELANERNEGPTFFRVSFYKRQKPFPYNLPYNRSKISILAYIFTGPHSATLNADTPSVIARCSGGVIYMYVCTKVHKCIICRSTNLLESSL